MSRFTKSRPDEVEAIKTAVFQIHNPSRRKKAMLHDCLYRHHLACTKALSILHHHLDHLTKVDDKELDREVDTLVGQVVTARPLSVAVKDGLNIHLKATMRSYRELLFLYQEKIKDKTSEEISKIGGVPGVPSINSLVPSEIDWAEKCEAFFSIIDFEDENLARDALLRESKAGLLRPAIFPRYSLSSGFALLRHPEKEQYYIYFNLHPKESRHAKPVNLRGLIDVRTNKPCNKGTTKTGVLFPINFSKEFQLEKFINIATPKTAKLIKSVKNDDETYYAHVSFTYVARKSIPQTIMGVDRGINNLASIAVIDDDGRVLAKENISGSGLRFVQRREEKRQKEAQKKGKRYRSKTRKAEADRAVHITANTIVALAKKYNAQVVMENLANLSDRSKQRGRSNFNRMLPRTQYQKLLSVLDYKLKIEGLPNHKKIHPAYTSMTCPQCGCIDKENRNRKDINNIFKCVSCHFEDDADLNAARIIALKWQWRDQLPPAQKKKTIESLMDGKYCFKRFLTSLVTTP